MTTHNKATFGVYRSKDEVNTAVTLLNALGFGDAPASVLFPDKDGPQDFPHVQKSELVKFAKIGSAIGAVLFFAFAIMATSGVIPFAPLQAAPVEGRTFALIAAVFLGGVVGAACGTLVGIGTPDRAGRRYGQYVHAGGILLSVQSGSAEQQKKIEEVLEKSGAQDITSVQGEQAWQDVLDEKGNLERVNLTQGSRQNDRPLKSAQELVESDHVSF